MGIIGSLLASYDYTVRILIWSDAEWERADEFEDYMNSKSDDYIGHDVVVHYGVDEYDACDNAANEYVMQTQSYWGGK